VCVRASVVCMRVRYRVSRSAVMGVLPPCCPKVNVGMRAFSSVGSTPHNCRHRAREKR
jgi:hypothetical protein